MSDVQKELLRNIKAGLRNLESLIQEVKIAEENCVYQVYSKDSDTSLIKESTDEIVRELKRISPYDNNHFCDRFANIIKDGVDTPYQPNTEKPQQEYPIFAAHFHARHFLEIAIKFGKMLEEPPAQNIPPGWAALLELYHIK